MASKLAPTVTPGPTTYSHEPADLSRGVQESLFPLHHVVDQASNPCLRHYGIAFYQYNPGVGGFLTDKFQCDITVWPTGSRFELKKGATHCRERYWNNAYLDALDSINPAAAKLGMSTGEASLRWARY